MQLTALRTALITRRYDGTVRNTRRTWTSKNYLLVELVAEDGSTGIGEMFCDGGGSPEAAIAMLRHDVAPHILKRDASLVGRLVGDLGRRLALSGRGTAASAAISAIDIALWDLFGKASRQPLHRLLGGHSDRAPVYASGGMYGIPVEHLAAEMAAAQRLGLRGAKVKVGDADPQEDFERLAAVRAAIGPAAPLMADAMFVPDVPTAIRLGRRLGSLDLHFFEAPTIAQDVEGWRDIAMATNLPLAGPELSDDLGLMRRMLEIGAVRYLQFDVTIAGGLSRGRALAALAAAFHRKVSLHCSGSAVALAAGAQLLAAIPNGDGLEFHLLHDGLRERLWASGWHLSEGCLVPPERPGIGLELSEEENAMLVAA